ncbi:hypothetical protein AVEN_231769-1 [Araneus ventricosus]|uniref:Uncharacterized protein n=1 Tax=Araneus ventricosus TaxID=182803 RepID=A0A4Y2UKR1_ARAVE|nr:hypothetical protein AVEN_231769-1 [Araneus ventricosus]
MNRVLDDSTDYLLATELIDYIIADMKKLPSDIEIEFIPRNETFGTEKMKQYLKYLTSRKYPVAKFYIDSFRRDEIQNEDPFVKFITVIGKEIMDNSSVCYIENFLNLIVVTAVISGIMFHYGLLSAPSISHVYIFTVVQDLKKLGKVRCNLLEDIETWLDMNKVNKPPQGCRIQEIVEDSFKLKFSRDLIRFVLEHGLDYVDWHRSGIFEEENLDSPFTPQVAYVVKTDLSKNLYKYERLYQNLFADKNQYELNFAVIKELFLQGPITFGNFMIFSITLAVFSGHLHCNNVVEAPIEATRVLIKTIDQLMEDREMNANFWSRLRHWAEARESNKIQELLDDVV